MGPGPEHYDEDWWSEYWDSLTEDEKQEEYQMMATYTEGCEREGHN